MKWKFRLGEAMNTYTPALHTLKERGYTLHSRFIDSSRTNEWIAVKDDRIFFAHNPLSLLGLVAMWEQKGDAWQQADKDNLYMQLVDDNFEV